MELIAKIEKPYSEELKQKFIVGYNHKQDFQIVETETALEAWAYTDDELQKKEKERIAKLKLTRGDVFRGLLQAKGVTRSYIRKMIEDLPSETSEEIFIKEMALIDFDEALDFYRGNNLIESIGLQLGISSEQLDNFFMTNDYKTLVV